MLRTSSWLALATVFAVGAGAGAIGCNATVGGGGDEGTGGSGAPGSGGTPAGQGGAPGMGGNTGTGPTGSGGAPGAGGATTAGGSGGARGTGGATGNPGVGGGVVTGAGGAVAGAAAYKGVANAACADMTTLKTSWYYNWGLSPSPASCTAPGFVPMIAGKSEKTAAAVTASLTRVANAKYDTVLGFNEPNKVDQSNLTVAQAIGMWPAITANAAIRVGSPATSADAPGQAWFTDFMNQATAASLRVDFIAIHWYGWNAGSCDARAAQLESYVQWAERIPGNRPIWITEWGCLNLSNPDPATVQAFYQAAVAMFARHPRIERYGWYQWTTNNELFLNGAITPLGTAFAAAPSTK